MPHEKVQFNQDGSKLFTRLRIRDCINIYGVYVPDEKNTFIRFDIHLFSIFI